MSQGFYRESSEAEFEPGRIAALISVGALAFTAWLGVVLLVPPERLLTYTAFFVPFWIFMACFAAAGIYAFTARSAFFNRRALSNSVREGSLIAGVVTVNLAILASHRWTPLIFLVSVAAAFLIEAVNQLRAAGEPV